MYRFLTLFLLFSLCHGFPHIIHCFTDTPPALLLFISVAIFFRRLLPYSWALLYALDKFVRIKHVALQQNAPGEPHSINALVEMRVLSIISRRPAVPFAGSWSAHNPVGAAERELYKRRHLKQCVVPVPSNGSR